jgi:hypothetical protein
MSGGVAGSLPGLIHETLMMHYNHHHSQGVVTDSPQKSRLEVLWPTQCGGHATHTSHDHDGSSAAGTVCMSEAAC